MNRTLLCALAAASTLAACSSNNNQNQDSGTSDSGNNPPPIINVSGTAYVHPQAVAWLTDAGMPIPSLTGLTLSVDEPLKVALGDPTGRFGSVTLDAGNTFSIGNVDTSVIVLGLAAAIQDEEPGVCTDGGLGEGPDAGCATPRVVNAASGIYDVLLSGGNRPSGDLSGTKAFAVPTSFHDQLTAAVTPATIQSITGQAASTLLGAGFILGEVVDSSGNPVSGVTVDVTADPNQVFYVSDDFRSVNTTGTGKTGLFIFVDNGSTMPTTFDLSVTNHPEYLRRNAGAAAGTCLVMTVFPGTTQP